MCWKQSSLPPNPTLCFHHLSSSSVFVQSLSRVPLFATPRAVAYQAPLSMGFSRPEYCFSTFWSIQSQKRSFIFYFSSHLPCLPCSHTQGHISHKASRGPGRNSFSFPSLSSVFLSMALTWHFYNIFATQNRFCTHCR